MTVPSEAPVPSVNASVMWAVSVIDSPNLTLGVALVVIFAKWAQEPPLTLKSFSSIELSWLARTSMF